MQKKAKSKARCIKLSYGEVVIRATSINKAIIDYLYIKHISIRGAVSYSKTTERFIHIVLYLRLYYYGQDTFHIYTPVLSLKDFIKQYINVED